MKKFIVLLVTGILFISGCAFAQHVGVDSLGIEEYAQEVISMDQTVPFLSWANWKAILGIIAIVITIILRVTPTNVNLDWLTTVMRIINAVFPNNFREGKAHSTDKIYKKYCKKGNVFND
jgi:hypothetical protein